VPGSNSGFSLAQSSDGVPYWSVQALPEGVGI